MAFFAPHFATSEGFAPLFSIINDFDGPAFQPKTSPASPATHPLAAYMAPSCTKRAPGSSGQRTVRRALPTFKPNFDVRETADAYELHGELAGLKKKDVSIEFTDAQTLVVRGRVERVYTKASPAKTQTQTQTEQEPKQVESAPNTEHDDAAMDVDSTTKDTIENQTSSGESATPQSPKAHKATVEDTIDEDDRFSVTSMSSTHSATPSHTEASVADASSTKKPAAQTSAEVAHKSSQSEAVTKPESDEAKYWVQERSVGEFSRTFSFPRLIRQDEVHASLEDGILTVVIPKSRNETRRVVIF